MPRGANRTKETSVNDETNTDVTPDEVPAPATSDNPSEPNPNNDLVPADEAGPVYPEGASRSHKAAIKKHYVASQRLTKLDARYAKAREAFEAAERELNEKRPAYAADVAEAEVAIEYHSTKAARIEKARNDALSAAQARAAGDHETATKLDEKAQNDDAPEDGDDDVTAHPTNAGHVEFE